MLDTCVVIDMLVDFDGLDKNVIALVEQIPLLSSDTRFWFYRNQGLDLIEY